MNLKFAVFLVGLFLGTTVGGLVGSWLATPTMVVQSQSPACGTPDLGPATALGVEP